MAFLLAFSLAVFSIRWHTGLFSTSTLLLFTSIASLLFVLSKHNTIRFKSALCLLLLSVSGGFFGLSFSHFYAAYALEKRLPEPFWNKNVEAEITIVSLPQEKSQARQFEARIETIQAAALQQLVGQKLLLKRYSQIDADIHSCERWSVVMRLKPVHGLKNNAGFDYQGFLFQQGIQIKGYLRSAEKLGSDNLLCINGWRERWRQYLQDHFLPDSPQMVAWLSALSIGDKSLLDTKQRETLQLSGSFHLFVISGLHIGLVAAAVYALTLLLRQLGGGLFYAGDWRPIAAFLSLSAAVFYGLMAGWQLPVQRALLTLFIFMSTSLCGLRWSLWRRFVVALFLVLLIQPMAGLNPGFILSFAAVFFLLLIQQYPWLSVTPVAVATKAHKHKVVSVLFYLREYIYEGRRRFMQLLLLQIGLCIGLMPFLLAFFQQWSWLMIVVNLIFIPLMGFIVIPLLLVAMVFWLVAQGVGSNEVAVSGWILDILAACFDLMMPMLTAFIEVMGADQPYSGFDTSRLLCLLLAVLFVLGPNILLNRLLALILFTAVVLATWPAVNWRWPQAAEPKIYLPENIALQLEVLDVGQGLSVLIQTPHHRLLYDTGSSWQSSSMVQWVHGPVFRQRGISGLDTVIISHTDNDHSGGLLPLMQQFNVQQLYADASLIAPLKKLESKSSPVMFYQCNSQVSWTWQKAMFQVLHPYTGYQHRNANNHSCVLQVSVAGRRILLTGDIESRVEKLLLQQGIASMDVLVVPHHGSKTSSGEDFLRMVQPKFALISAGFLNRYGHPHRDVVARYQKLGIQLMNTADHGRIRLQVFNDGSIKWQSAAEDKLFYH